MDVSHIMREYLPHILIHMGWLRSVASIKLHVSFAKEPYKRDDILQKRPVILSFLLTEATHNRQSVCLTGENRESVCRIGQNRESVCLIGGGYDE